MSKVIKTEGLIEILSTYTRQGRRYNRPYFVAAEFIPMSNTLERTQAMLAKHHRDGQRFAQMMRESYPARYDEYFWQAWDKWMDPVIPESAVMMDLGSAIGLFITDLKRRYPDSLVYGVECAPYMLENMEPLPEGVEVLVEDLHDPHFPLEENSVDGVYCSVVLHEMHQPVKALMEVNRVLKPGGRFYLTDWVKAPLKDYITNQDDEVRVFSRDRPVDELDDLFIHFIEHNRFTREDMEYLLQMTDFKLIHSESTKEGRFARFVVEKA